LKSIDWNDDVILTWNGRQVGALVMLCWGRCACVLPERTRRAVDKRLEVFCC
jgi:hypothetical protein